MSDDSPEILELDYTLGVMDWRIGRECWTHNAEYVCTAFEPGKRLQLTRKDVYSQEIHGS